MRLAKSALSLSRSALKLSTSHSHAVSRTCSRPNCWVVCRSDIAADSSTSVVIGLAIAATSSVLLADVGHTNPDVDVAVSSWKRTRLWPRSRRLTKSVLTCINTVVGTLRISLHQHVIITSMATRGVGFVSAVANAQEYLSLFHHGCT